MRGNRLIIVGGAPRSGTSMFQSMMDSHRDVFGGPEFDHLTDIVHLRNRLHTGLQYGRIEQFVDAAQIDAAIAQLIDALLLPAADRRQCSYLSEKTPMNVLVFKDLMQILPGARFVHIVRDPRAVMISMLMVAQRLEQKAESKPDFLASPAHMAQYITDCVQAGVDACESHRDRAIIVRYEDLLTRTAHIMTQVLSFLGLPEDPAVLKPGAVTHDSAQLLKDGQDAWAGGRARFSDPEPENLDKWRTQVDAAAVQTLNEHFASIPLFAALGYTFN
ncbi:sulfotransferase [Uliginosibacterium sediminicola]|uniref:Sulfotransferase n=1 Tax=Uliginosibacterium sediminicola TaxID=2024550 RepID=A0ABU9YVE9_9RHOO